MTIEEYFAEGDGPYAVALRPLSGQLTRQAKARYEQKDAAWKDRLSPWVTHLGKGGERVDRKTGQQTHLPEISLYRHVADVGFLAAYLFYWAWQGGTVPISVRDDEIVDYLAIILVIATCHDADKYVGGPSSSPTIAQIQTVWDDLAGFSWISSAIWPEFTVESLHAAVSLVENRGQSQALLGPSLPPIIQYLAHIVGQADNFMAHTAVANADAAWIQTYNQKMRDWHALYQVPESSIRLVEFQESPAVLHRVVAWVRNSETFFPPLVVRNGRHLAVSLPESISTESFLTLLESQAFRTPKQPRLHVGSPMNPWIITLKDCENLEDVGRIVTAYTQDAVAVLRIKQKDRRTVEPYLTEWVRQASGIYECVWQRPSQSQTIPSIAPSSNGFLDGSKWTDPYVRALLIGLLLRNGDVSAYLKHGLADVWPEMTESLHARLSAAIPTFDTLDMLTQGTLFAYESARYVSERTIEDFVVWAYGSFPKRPTVHPGATGIVQRLRLQTGCSPTAVLSDDSPYDAPDPNKNSGKCLICGASTTQQIDSTLELYGIKTSAFNDRIGHQRYASTGNNFICPTCEYTQTLLVQMNPPPPKNPNDVKAPLIIGYPVRSYWHTPLESHTRMVHSTDIDGEWERVLPWRSDPGHLFPLGFEELPTRDIRMGGAGDDVLSQIRRLSLYAAMSGEPVHVFIATQRPLPTAFYYEPLPGWLSDVLGGLHRQDECPGVSRQDLPEWLERIDLIQALSRLGNGRETLMDLLTFGWWVGAWAIEAKNSKEQTARLQNLRRLKEWYPSMEYYDTLIQQAAKDVGAIQTDLKPNGSRSDVLSIFRLVFDEYQALYGQPHVTHDFLMETITGLIYQKLDNSIRSIDRSKVSAAAQSCLKIIELAEASDQITPKMIRYLLAACEVTLREEVQQRINVALAARKKGAKTTI